MEASHEAGLKNPLESQSVHRPCSEVLAVIQEALVPAGLRALITFDLQAARERAADRRCPHHGFAVCDCQLVILLVYGKSVTPATLILDGSDGQTRLSMPDDEARPVDAETAAVIEQSIQAMLDPPGGE